VAIKQVEHGLFSTWALNHFHTGAHVDVMMPMGNFTCTLSASNKKHYVLVGAGSGITPLMSIARSVLVSEPNSEVSLIYGNRLFQSIIFREQLEDMKDRYLGRFRVFHVLSKEPNDVDLFYGRIDRDKLEGFAKSFIQVEGISEVFVCGPEPMIRATKEFMIENGVPAEHVHFELFASPGQGAQAPVKEAPKENVDTTKQCAVTVMYDGQETNFFMAMDGTKILDAAQKHGLDIPFSCKGGMCCTCRAHLSEGKAEMAVNYALEPGEVESGYVLTCQAEPQSDHVYVDFDRH
jgi:ring-1,2-phenylacetyl-CoA epoxidase subunit PaaE